MDGGGSQRYKRPKKTHSTPTYAFFGVPPESRLNPTPLTLRVPCALCFVELGWLILGHVYVTTGGTTQMVRKDAQHFEDEVPGENTWW